MRDAEKKRIVAENAVKTALAEWKSASDSALTISKEKDDFQKEKEQIERMALERVAQDTVHKTVELKRRHEKVLAFMMPKIPKKGTNK